MTTPEDLAYKCGHWCDDMCHYGNEDKKRWPAWDMYKCIDLLRDGTCPLDKTLDGVASETFLHKMDL